MTLPPLEGPARLRPQPPRRVEIGHVHLMVGDVGRSVRFYVDGLGLELTARMGDDAAFASVGGYHHNIGVNSWYTRNRPAAPESAAGLIGFRVEVAKRELAEAVAARAAELGGEPEAIREGAAELGGEPEAIREGAAELGGEPEAVPDGIVLRGPDGERCTIGWREAGDGLAGAAPEGAAGPRPLRDDPLAEITNVTLRVRDPEAASRVWSSLGFEAAPRGAAPGTAAAGTGGAFELRSGDGVPQITLSPGASQPQPDGLAGLFHVALRYPSLDDLVAAAVRARAAGMRPTGAADHGFNLAAYFRDPDGIGVELYWNLERPDWPPPAPGARIALLNDPLPDGPLRRALI